MSYKDYDPIFEDYIMMFPFVKDQIVDWFHIDKFMIGAHLIDGTFDTYDGIERCGTHYKSYEDYLMPPENDRKWKIRFARNLYRKMCMAGYTQEELAQETGISVGTISNYMNGISEPSALKLYKIANALGYDMNNIFDI